MWDTRRAKTFLRVSKFYINNMYESNGNAYNMTNTFLQGVEINPAPR